MKAVILAGGKGTRLFVLTQSTPKPMVPLCNKPLLQYQIELLRDYKVTDITLVTNHLGNLIKSYFKDGKKFGVNINYFEEKIPLGTAGSVREIAYQLKEDFLLLYGDLLVNMNLQRLINFHNKNNGIGTLVVHPNNHPFDSDIIGVNGKNKIMAIHPKPHKKEFIYHNLVNAALYVLSPTIYRYIPKGRPSDFGNEIFPTILNKKRTLFAYKTHEYVKDIGTIQRLHEAEEDVKNNIYQLGNFTNKRPAIFFDRDGVINKEVDNIRRVDEVELLAKTNIALKKVNNSRFLAIIVTNQPQVAKGFCSMDTLKNINKKVETLLGNEGVKIDGFYFCPHHPEKGFPGENRKYKISCTCRKPKIRMISQAVNDFNIDLSQSYIVGDTTTDAMTAKNAGIPFIGVKTGYGCKDNKFDIKIPLLFKDINEAVNYVLKRN